MSTRSIDMAQVACNHALRQFCLQVDANWLDGKLFFMLTLHWGWQHSDACVIVLLDGALCFVGVAGVRQAHPAGLCPLRPSSPKLRRSFGARGSVCRLAVLTAAGPRKDEKIERLPSPRPANQLMFLSLLPFLLPGIAALRDGVERQGIG